MPTPYCLLVPKYAHPAQCVLTNAIERADRCWLVQPVDGERREWTFAQAADEIGRMATALREMGLAPGTKVAISGYNTAHFLMADYAIALAGYVSVGLYPKQSAAHVTYILRHCEAQVVFVGPMPDVGEFIGAVPDEVQTVGLPYPGVPECDTTWDELIAGREPVREYQTPADDELLTLIYTSGSTGDPKGVMITHGNVLFVIEGFTTAFPNNGQERMFSYLPLAHAFERGVVGWASAVYACEVYFLSNPRALADELAAYAPSRMFGVPLVWGRIQQGIIKNIGADRLNVMTSIPILRRLVRRKILEGAGLQNARTCISGSAPLPIPVLQWFVQVLGIDVLQGYSLTETTLYATANTPSANRLGSVGRALPGCEIKISDEGEILIRHAGVMPGYYKNPEKTNEVMTADGFFRSGDKGRVDEDGYVWITGRTKDIFKTLKGKYVAPAPIEGAMSSNGVLGPVRLVGAGLNQPLLLATLSDEGRAVPRGQVEKSLVATMQEVNKTLEPHEKIGKIVVITDEWSIDNGLMTPTLKVKGAAIEDRYRELIEAEAAVRGDISWQSESEPEPRAAAARRNAT